MKKPATYKQQRHRNLSWLLFQLTSQQGNLQACMYANDKLRANSGPCEELEQHYEEVRKQLQATSRLVLRTRKLMAAYKQT